MRVITHTHVIGAGEKTSSAFAVSKLVANRENAFFCPFLGHWSLMKGTHTLI